MLLVNRRTSVNLGSCSSYDRWKSYGNCRYACFHSVAFRILYYFSGICISAPEKKHIKQVTKTEVEEYTAEEIVNSDISEGK